MLRFWQQSAKSCRSRASLSRPVTRLLCYNADVDRDRTFQRRPLNAPRPVRVIEDANGMPTSVNGRPVARIVDRWRIDDEWWREPISRMYFDVELAGGIRWTGFKDLISGQWYEQRV